MFSRGMQSNIMIYYSCLLLSLPLQYYFRFQLFVYKLQSYLNQKTSTHPSPSVPDCFGRFNPSSQSFVAPNFISHSHSRLSSLFSFHFVLFQKSLFVRCIPQYMNPMRTTVPCLLKARGSNKCTYRNSTTITPSKCTQR